MLLNQYIQMYSADKNPASKIRALLWMPGGDRVPGGHYVQIQQTCKHLRFLDVDANISFAADADVSGYDIVHGFGLGPKEVRYCRQRGLPVVLSTIYWNDYVTFRRGSSQQWHTWEGRGRTGFVLLRSALQGRHVEKCAAITSKLQGQRVVFEMSDLLLPNSQMEADAIQADLTTTTPYHVVPNAVDPTMFNPAATQGSIGRNHVLFVGRFEPHKNQLGLIEAMRGADIPTVLVGPPHPHHPAYYEHCKRQATKNITILPGVPQEKLAALYSAAKVHVLPSGFETTGLVSLEAALCGCNIVTTDRGYTREYFQDMAWYCDPYDPQSIRRAIEVAFHAPYKSDLRDHILSNYTWEHTAQATLAGYRMLISARQETTHAR